MRRFVGESMTDEERLRTAPLRCSYCNEMVPADLVAMEAHSREKHPEVFGLGGMRLNSDDKERLAEIEKLLRRPVPYDYGTARGREFDRQVHIALAWLVAQVKALREERDALLEGAATAGQQLAGLREIARVVATAVEGRYATTVLTQDDYIVSKTAVLTARALVGQG